MIVTIDIDKITPNPWQTRQGDPDPESVKALALDIATNGLLQVPVARLVDDTEYLIEWSDEDQLVDRLKRPGARVQLAFGHTRLAAFRWLRSVGPNSNIPGDWSTMPVNIQVLTDQQMADYAWSENERRRDVGPIERAYALEKRKANFGWTQDELAQHCGLSRPAVSNILRLCKLPDEAKAALSAGNLSERAALAMAPLYDLPEVIRKKAERYWAEDYKPSQIVADARSGLSSDEIRERIDGILQRHGTPLEGIRDFGLDDVFEVGGKIVAPTCRECPARAKHKNVCCDSSCLSAKISAANARSLAAAAAASGIPPLESDLKYWDVTRLGDRTQDGKTIARSGCPNLRLVLVNSHGDAVPTVEGYPQAVIVCNRRNGQCTCASGADALRQNEEIRRAGLAQPGNAAPAQGEAVDVTSGEDVVGQNPAVMTAADLQAAAKQARRDKKVYEQAAADARARTIEIVSSGLLGGNAGAWRALLDRLSTNPHNKRPTDTAEIVREIAGKIIESWAGWQDPRHVPAILNRSLANAGLPQMDGSVLPPDSLQTLASRFLQIVKRQVDSLRYTAPTLSQLRGILSDLEGIKLGVEDADIPDGGEMADWAEAILEPDSELLRWIERIEELVEIVMNDGWAEAAQGFSHVYYLTANGFSGQLFASSLADAHYLLLRYALALVAGDQARIIAAEIDRREGVPQ